MAARRNTEIETFPEGFVWNEPTVLHIGDFKIEWNGSTDWILTQTVRTVGHRAKQDVRDKFIGYYSYLDHALLSIWREYQHQLGQHQITAVKELADTIIATKQAILSETAAFSKVVKSKHLVAIEERLAKLKADEEERDNKAAASIAAKQPVRRRAPRRRAA